MDKVPARYEPVPLAPVQAPGVSLRLASPQWRYSLRARSTSTIAALLGRPVPDPIGRCTDGIARLGPDEWYARLSTPLPPEHGGASASVVDISERAVSIVVEGPRARQVIAAGCPLDLEYFQPGRATRTVFEQTEIILMREADERFVVDIWRSFASYFWALSEQAARDGQA